MATSPPATSSSPEPDTTDHFSALSPELRNMIYELVLEDDKQAIPGDNRAAVMEDQNHHSVDWRSLQRTKLPAIAQVNKQIRHESLSILFGDYLPAMKVFRFGGPQYGYDCYGSWMDLFGKDVVPYLRYFLLDTGTSKVAVVLHGSKEEVEVLESEEASASVESVAVAITHINNQALDENVPAWVEYAAEDLLSKLESLLQGSNRLSFKKFRYFARYCLKKLGGTMTTATKSQKESMTVWRRIREMSEGTTKGGEKVHVEGEGGGERDPEGEGAIR
ncbi:hypothetical protein PRZ48_007862 [Zasmidium cellare]|uniref:2EXR domain-containing protein n=1 Tax=Zasmidium cellare TaxID=395010 RepID=A0ABR0EKG4_ZASCE|nr:hypothetical protein PRZ48_007862 [Zasmidium cellare]